MKRILSLDGGGSWAVTQVILLQELYGEHATGHQVLEKFDLVVANSGGSIVAGALAVNARLSDLRAMFDSEDKRQTIFVRNNNILFQALGAMSDSVAFHRYDADQKLKGLKTVMLALDVALKDLSSAAKKLMIMGFNYRSNRGKFFRNYESLSSPQGKITATTLAEAIHASSNAPLLYFDEPAQTTVSGQEEEYWDGAMAGFNNPVLVGVIEALAHGTRPEEIEVISIGTVSTQLPMPGLARDFPELVQTFSPSSLARDISKGVKTIIQEPPSWATFSAYIASGNPPSGGPHDQRFVRINPIISPILLESAQTWELPANVTIEQWRRFLEVDMDAVEDADYQVIKQIAERYLAGDMWNEPVQMGANNACHIGHRTWGEAYLAACNMLGITPRSERF